MGIESPVEVARVGAEEAQPRQQCDACSSRSMTCGGRPCKAGGKERRDWERQGEKHSSRATANPLPTRFFATWLACMAMMDWPG